MAHEDGTPGLVETLTAIHAEAAKAREMLTVAERIGEKRIHGGTALSKIEIMARDRLESPISSSGGRNGKTNGASR